MKDSHYLMPLMKGGLLKIEKATNLKQAKMEFGLHFPLGLEVLALMCFIKY